MTLEYESLTERIIGAGIEVHKRLGPGFLESIYQKALVVELRKRRLQVEQEVEVVIEYDGVEVGHHRIDLLVEKIIIVELKAIKHLEEIHFSIVRSYLKAIGQAHGLLLNFARQRLEILRQTSDGFKIAEKDLELRGPGEVLGTRQTGMLQFRVADLARDAHLLSRIPPVADSLLKHHPKQVDKLIQRWVGDSARYVGV